jgi:hypothetical protein
MVLSGSQLNDMVAVEVRITQHSERGPSGWRTSPSTVELHVDYSGGVVLQQLEVSQARVTALVASG